MKVLLISHPSANRQKPDFPPIGIAYLGSAINKQGHDVQLIDSSLMGETEILSRAKAFAPDVVGITCWTIGRGAVWKFCALLNQAVPAARLVIGGPHASFYPEHLFRKTHASAVVIGEGEETFCELLTAFACNTDLSGVKGIAYKNAEGDVVRTVPRPQSENLDSIAFPGYEWFVDFSFKKYGGFSGLPGPVAAIITSRGCVFDCSYCGSVNFWGRKWRARSAENVLNEIEHLVRRMAVKSVYMFDDNFPVNKQRAKEICRGLIDRKLGVKWACCSHVKMVDAELLAIMKSSGCISIDFGVESGSDIVLGNINKSQTRKDIERAFSLAHAAGINPRAYLMVGNKGETAATIDETIDMVAEIKPYSSIGASILWLLPGTQVFREARGSGFIDDEYWVREDCVPYNLQEHTFAELFALRQRLMRGIALRKGGIVPMLNFYLKSVYYKYPLLSSLRSLIPDFLR